MEWAHSIAARRVGLIAELAHSGQVPDQLLVGEARDEASRLERNDGERNAAQRSGMLECELLRILGPG